MVLTDEYISPYRLRCHLQFDFSFVVGWPSWLARSVATWILRAIVDRTRPSSRAKIPAMVDPPGASYCKMNYFFLDLILDEREERTADCIFNLCRVDVSLQYHSSRTLERYTYTHRQKRIFLLGHCYSLWAASSKASILGNPIITPPSAIASKKVHTNAGPEPAKAVHASKCFSSRKRHRPMDENMLRMMLLSVSWCGEGGRFDMTVMPSRIYGMNEKWKKVRMIRRVWTFFFAYVRKRLRWHTLHGVLGIARTTRVEGKTQLVSWRMVTPARILMRSFPSSASVIPSSLRIVCASWGLQL